MVFFQPMTAPTNFAAALTAAIDQSNLSRAEIAVATGYSVSALSKFLGGHREPPARARQPMLDAIERAANTKRKGGAQ